MKNRRNNKYAEASQALKAKFGEMLIKDATKPLTMLPNLRDLEHAVQHDPHNCLFAKTCARLLNSHHAYFYKGAVYIDHHDENGVVCIHRYLPSSAAIRTLVAFDEGKLKPGDHLRAFYLRPPSPSRTRAGMSANRKSWRRTSSGRAIEEARHAKLRVKVIARDIENLKERKARLEQRYSPDVPSVKECKQQLSRLRKRLPVAREDFAQKQQRANEARRRPPSAQGRQTPKTMPLEGRGGEFFWHA